MPSILVCFYRLVAGEDGGGGGGKGKESYEKTVVTHGSKLMYRFCKRLSICPQQIIRYTHSIGTIKACL